MSIIKRNRLPRQLLPCLTGQSKASVVTVDGPLEPQDQLVRSFTNYAAGKPVSQGVVYRGYSLVQDCRSGPGTLYVLDAHQSVVGQFNNVQLTVNELNKSVVVRSLRSALQQTVYPWLGTTVSNYNAAGSTIAAHWYPNQPDSVHAFVGGHQVPAALSSRGVDLGDGSVLPLFVPPSLLRPG